MPVICSRLLVELQHPAVAAGRAREKLARLVHVQQVIVYVSVTVRNRVPCAPQPDAPASQVLCSLCFKGGGAAGQGQPPEPGMRLASTTSTSAPAAVQHSPTAKPGRSVRPRASPRAASARPACRHLRRDVDRRLVPLGPPPHRPGADLPSASATVGLPISATTSRQRRMGGSCREQCRTTEASSVAPSSASASAPGEPRAPQALEPTASVR